MISLLLLLLLGRQREAAERADMANREPVEDAVLMEGMGVGHHPEFVARLKILQAHGALRLTRLAHDRLVQTRNGLARGWDTAEPTEPVRLLQHHHSIHSSVRELHLIKTLP